MQLGPIITALPFCTTSSRRSCSAAPSGPVSLNPAESTMNARQEAFWINSSTDGIHQRAGWREWQIHRCWQFACGSEAGNALYAFFLGIDAVHSACKGIVQDVSEHFPAGFGDIVGGSHHNNGFWMNQIGKIHEKTPEKRGANIKKSCPAPSLKRNFRLIQAELEKSSENSQM
jgi:hypothetical protein